MTTPKPPLDIEELRKRHRELETRRTRAEADLENASRQLDAVKAESRERYGTDDLSQLRRKLDEMRAQNEQKRAQYQAHLEEIEAALKRVEEGFARGDNP